MEIPAAAADTALFLSIVIAVSFVAFFVGVCFWRWWLRRRHVQARPRPTHWSLFNGTDADVKQIGGQAPRRVGGDEDGGSGGSGGSGDDLGGNDSGTKRRRQTKGGVSRGTETTKSVQKSDAVDNGLVFAQNECIVHPVFAGQMNLDSNPVPPRAPTPPDSGVTYPPPSRSRTLLSVTTPASPSNKSAHPSHRDRPTPSSHQSQAPTHANSYTLPIQQPHPSEQPYLQRPSNASSSVGQRQVGDSLPVAPWDGTWSEDSGFAGDNQNRRWDITTARNDGDHNNHDDSQVPRGDSTHDQDSTHGSEHNDCGYEDEDQDDNNTNQDQDRTDSESAAMSISETGTDDLPAQNHSTASRSNSNAISNSNNPLRYQLGSVIEATGYDEHGREVDMTLRIRERGRSRERAPEGERERTRLRGSGNGRGRAREREQGENGQGDR